MSSTKQPPRFDRGGCLVRPNAEAEADPPSSPASVIFQPASGVVQTAVAQLQATLRRRVLRAFVGRFLPVSSDIY